MDAAPHWCPTPDKRVYRSKAKAARAQRLARPPVGQVKERLYPYQCRCGAWHLTHLHPRKGDQPA